MHGRGMESEHFLELLESFNHWLRRLNYAKQTIKSRTRHLKSFLTWIEERGINNLQNVSQKDLEEYNIFLHQKPIKSRTIEAYLSVLKLLNEYLENYGETPIVKVKLEVQKGIKTERTILTKMEVDKLYECCKENYDRVLLAIYYGCGLRCREGIYLELGDIDFANKLLHVRRGKNYRQRYVPMSKGVAMDIKTWMEGERKWYGEQSDNYLLPNRFGGRAHGSSLNKRLKKLCKMARIDKKITLHCLRHSIATHLLDSGMALEKISQFLGHQSLEATQIYTRINEEL